MKGSMLAVALLVLAACKGPEGPEGPTGPRGPTGSTGPTGQAIGGYRPVYSALCTVALSALSVGGQSKLVTFSFQAISYSNGDVSTDCSASTLCTADEAACHNSTGSHYWVDGTAGAAAMACLSGPFTIDTLEITQSVDEPLVLGSFSDGECIVFADEDGDGWMKTTPEPGPG